MFHNDQQIQWATYNCLCTLRLYSQNQCDECIEIWMTYAETAGHALLFINIYKYEGYQMCCRDCCQYFCQGIC